MAAPKLNVGQKAVKTVNTVGRKLEGSCIFVLLIIITALIYAATVFFNFLASDPALSKGLFKHGIANISKEYPVNITPAGWAFAIWGVIYLFQLAWVIYSLGLICRRTEEGPAYLNPVVLSPAFFIFFSLSSAFNTGWLFLWDRLLFLAAFIFLACIALSLSLTLVIASVRVSMFTNNLVDQGRKSEVKFLQAAVINGVAMYATWTTIASLVNLNTVLVYKLNQPVAGESASIICLGILAFLVVVYIGLDVTVLERFTRYSLTPYLVVIWALSAILAKNYNSENVSSIMSAVLLGAVALAFLIKVGVTFYRGRNEQYQYRPMKMGRRPLNAKE